MQMLEESVTREHVVRELAQHDISPTRQRVEIGMLLFGCNRHVSADQLMEEIRSESSGVVSKATVYNTLGLFARKGLIRELIIDPSRVVYDTNTAHHHHFYNVETGQLQDVSADVVDLSRLPALEDGLSVEGVDVIIRVKPDLKAS